jgi:predicted glutamine amidotransferase
MCRLFGMSGGNVEVQATFWLLDAPTSLLVQSQTQPDGVGLGTFDSEGRPLVYRKPVALSRSQTFISEAHEVRSKTFLAHVRHATAGEPIPENTHPFEQHNRLCAHNGVLGELPRLRERLGPYADLVKGSTDSELYFTLITRRIEEAGGDIAAGIAAAAQELARDQLLYSLNIVLTTATDVWALRYPHTNELWILERSIGGIAAGDSLDQRSDFGITRVFSGELSLLPSTVIASQPMDRDPAWRLLESGELVHIDPALRVTSQIVVSHPPAQLMELNTEEAAAQREDPTAEDPAAAPS